MVFFGHEKLVIFFTLYQIIFIENYRTPATIIRKPQMITTPDYSPLTTHGSLTEKSLFC